MKIKTVKKTFDIPSDLNKEIQQVLDANYGTTFAQITQHALRQWLEKPTIEIKRPADKEKKGIKR